MLQFKKKKAYQYFCYILVKNYRIQNLIVSYAKNNIILICRHNFKKSIMSDWFTGLLVIGFYKIPLEAWKMPTKKDCEKLLIQFNEERPYLYTVELNIPAFLWVSKQLWISSKNDWASAKQDRTISEV